MYLKSGIYAATSTTWLAFAAINTLFQGGIMHYYSSSLYSCYFRVMGK